MNAKKALGVAFLAASIASSIGSIAVGVKDIVRHSHQEPISKSDVIALTGLSAGIAIFGLGSEKLLRNHNPVP